MQPFVRGGAELLAGAVQDPVFGPLVAFGPGGVFAELIGEAQFRLAPLTDVDAQELVRSGKAGRLVAGFRGAPPADESALVDLLLRLSLLAEELPEVAELDLNPVLALPDRCVAVDARIRVAEPTRAPREVLVAVASARAQLRHSRAVERLRARAAATRSSTSRPVWSSASTSSPEADGQQPHADDEIYIVLEGTGALEVDGDQVDLRKSAKRSIRLKSATAPGAAYSRGPIAPHVRRLAADRIAKVEGPHMQALRMTFGRSGSADGGADLAFELVVPDHDAEIASVLRESCRSC